MAVNRVDLGELALSSVVTSRFALDGGSMFGIVPRMLWEKEAPPDGRNRISLNANSLVVDSPGKRVLIEAGMGDKYDGKWRDIYALEGPGAAKALEASGFTPQSIDIVVLTHLHLDHAGGCTVNDPSGVAVPAFPRARYMVQEAEWRFAKDPHPLARGSYAGADFLPLAESGVLELVSGRKEVAPGVWVEPVPGHTRGHQVVRLVSSGREALYMGDVVPTRAHLNPNWLMSWDLEPEVLFAEKVGLLEDAADRGVLLFFSHDPGVAAGRVSPGARGAFVLEEGSVVEAAVNTATRKVPSPSQGEG